VPARNPTANRPGGGLGPRAGSVADQANPARRLGCSGATRATGRPVLDRRTPRPGGSVVDDTASAAASGSTRAGGHDSANLPTSS
jgi:hypothetical protein